MPFDPDRRKILGGATADKLSQRLERGELDRVSVPGGGHVYRGEVATRALQAVGARAMTLDRSIVVGEDFDPTRPEDQALYAHERYHADQGDGGGGGSGENFRDAEEIAARAVERMVLHRAMAGGYEGGAQPGAGGSSGGAWGDGSGGSVSPGAPTAEEKPESRRHAPDPERGYQAMLDQGMTRADIVEELARRVVDTQDQGHQASLLRAGDAKRTI